MQLRGGARGVLGARQAEAIATSPPIQELKQKEEALKSSLDGMAEEVKRGDHMLIEQQHAITGLIEATTQTLNRIELQEESIVALGTSVSELEAKAAARKAAADGAMAQALRAPDFKPAAKK